MKIPPVRVELCNAETERERVEGGLSKLKVAFRNFANAPREE